jgi:hypothetical protein
MKKCTPLTAANNLGADGLVEFCIGGFEPGPECLRTVTNLWIRIIRELLRSEPSKSGIEVVQCDKALTLLLWVKERRVGLQAAE